MTGCYDDCYVHMYIVLCKIKVATSQPIWKKLLHSVMRDEHFYHIAIISLLFFLYSHANYNLKVVLLTHKWVESIALWNSKTLSLCNYIKGGAFIMLAKWSILCSLLNWLTPSHYISASKTMYSNMRICYCKHASRTSYACAQCTFTLTPT